MPHYDDEDLSNQTRAARDPETGQSYEVPADMTYPEWKKVVDGDGDFTKWKTVAKSFGSDILKLIKVEMDALTDYKSFESYLINDALRNTDKIESLSEREQQLIKALDSALPKIKTYRGNLVRTVDFSDWTDAAERTKHFLEEFSPGEKKFISQYWSTLKGEGYNEAAGVKIYIQNTTC